MNVIKLFAKCFSPEQDRDESENTSVKYTQQSSVVSNFV